jgi:Lar family restriction alleviation protein
MQQDLRPCPFCGGCPKATESMGEVWILCKKCGASSGMHNEMWSVVKAWNTRKFKNIEHRGKMD